jgi:hypothetical protein
MSRNVKCNLCGELVTRSSSFCENCGSDLSSGRITRFSFQDTGFDRLDTSRSVVPTVDPKELQVLRGTPNFFLDFILNVFYLIISYGIFQTTLDAIRFLNIDLFGERFSPNDGYVLLALWGLIALSMIRGYLTIKIAPPNPYPDGYKLPNTLFGIIIFPIFFIGLPYMFLGLPLAILVTFIVLITFFFTPYRDRKNPTLRGSRMKSLTESQEYYRDTESIFSNEKSVSAFDLTEPIDDPRTGFMVNKSGNFETTYRITYPGKREFIVAFRSARNRIILYATILIIFPGLPIFFNLFDPFIFPAQYNLDLLVFQLMIIPSILLMALFLFFYPNKWVLIRRFSILDEQGTRIGSIKGNLYFSHWKISDMSGQFNSSLKFTLSGHKGEIKTRSGIFSVSGNLERTNVVDSQNNNIFSLVSSESRFIRKNFEIESNYQLDPFLIGTFSVCIIERFYKPESQGS